MMQNDKLQKEMPRDTTYIQYKYYAGIFAVQAELHEEAIAILSVIVSRALPDVRDGFKPVHRRVLFGMNELGNTSDKPTKKSARIVGEVMGKYHPHGDSSIYGTLVRMAQPWAMRYCLVDGQGNFGSVDGDGAAAMRYTEARLSKLAEEMLRDIEKDTVDMVPNFDDSLLEPAVLPCRFPNLLVNGASGIAVGMATNMPTHNLSEVIDGCCAYIDNIKARMHDASVEEITVEDLMEYVKAPDFPTGGTIYGYQGVKDAFETGRGRIVIRSNAEIETDDNGRERIIITELPYGVVKSDLVKNIAELVNDKKIEGIADICDHSKRDIRIVVEVKRDANAQVVLNKLYKFTALQSSFAVNNIAPHLTFLAVQRNEFLALLSKTHMDLIALDLVGIERMKRLAALVKHEVRDIHDIIDWPQTNRQQAVLKPIRTFFDGHPFDTYARITRTSLRCFNNHADR